jgi:PBSX family phage portal protein
VTDQTDTEKTSGGNVFRLAGLQKAEVLAAPRTAIASNAKSPEDEYLQYYLNGPRDIGAIQPPYDLWRLDRLAQENNALGPCVEAMVTNIDGTGFDIVPDTMDSKDKGESDSDAKVKELWEFFAEPWPGVSFATMRKDLRRDLERTGNAYLEVLRNAKDEIVFLRKVDSKMMRLLKLEDPIPVEIELTRGGKTVKQLIMHRPRRFVQLVNGIHIVYFKEFGSANDLNKTTGVWARKGQRVGVKDRATEILHFTALPDAHTPYGVPRWIGQMPSVLGSRKAEEFNVDFFDNGGVPPVLILLQGGTLAPETRKALENATLGRASKNNRVAVIETEPNGGSMDSPSQSRVTVERFGSDRQNDSMFEKYDERCEVRVRRAFRLPPIFVGQAEDYSFATAFASYTVGEAQVFRPERDEFDEVISVKLLPAMGFGDYRMQSKPLNIEDATLKLQGIEVAISTEQVDAAEVLDAINETVGTNLKVSTEKLTPNTLSYIQANNPAPEPSMGSQKGPSGSSKPPQKGAKQLEDRTAKPPKATPQRSPAVRKEEEDLMDLFTRTQDALAKQDIDAFQALLSEVNQLSSEELEEFQALVSDVQLTAHGASH